MLNVKCVLFDMDGTLSNTLDDLKAALNFTLNSLGLPTRSTEEVRSFVGNGIDVLVERGLPEGKKHLSKEASIIFRNYYKEHLTDYTRPYDGINDVIDTLVKNGVKIGIVSNKLQSPLENIVHSFWGDKIGAVCGITDYYPEKPAPDMVNICLERLNVNKEEAIYVGDSLVDVETAYNAKIKFIACSWGFCPKEKLVNVGCDDIIDTPMQILDYVK